jgi:hypothetical protein
MASDADVATQLRSKHIRTLEVLQVRACARARATDLLLPEKLRADMPVQPQLHAALHRLSWQRMRR